MRPQRMHSQDAKVNLFQAMEEDGEAVQNQTKKHLSSQLLDETTALNNRCDHLIQTFRDKRT